jgi:hypothetical protein
MHHSLSKIHAAIEELITDPKQILGVLAIKGNTRSNPCMT